MALLSPLQPLQAKALQSAHLKNDAENSTKTSTRASEISDQFGYDEHLIKILVRMHNLFSAMTCFLLQSSKYKDDY